MISPLDLVDLRALMGRGQGRPDVTVAIIDGPVALNHPDLAGTTIRYLPGKLKGACSRSGLRVSDVLTTSAPGSVELLAQEAGGTWLRTLSELGETIPTGEPGPPGLRHGMVGLPQRQPAGAGQLW